MRRLAPLTAIALLAVVCLGEFAAAQPGSGRQQFGRQRFVWKNVYAVQTAQPVPDTIYVVQRRPNDSDEPWSDYSEFDNENDASYRLFWIAEHNAYPDYEFRIVEREPQLEWQTREAFEELEDAQSLKSQLEETTGLHVRIRTFLRNKTSDELKEVPKDHAIEIPGKPGAWLPGIDPRDLTNGPRGPVDSPRNVPDSLRNARDPSQNLNPDVGKSSGDRKQLSDNGDKPAKKQVKDDEPEPSQRKSRLRRFLKSLRERSR